MEDDEFLFADGFDNAFEYMEFNVVGAFVGEKTPVFIMFLPVADFE